MSDIDPTLVVFQPQNNLVVTPNQPFLVMGQVTNPWHNPEEPVTIRSVTVQVDGEPLIEATRKIVPNKHQTIVMFKAFAEVTGGQDPHTVTVTATNDNGLSATSTVSVFTGPIFAVDAPALELDIRPFIVHPNDPIFDPNDPKIQKLIGRIQQQLRPLSTLLASSGKVLIGPNLVVTNDSDGKPVVRMGLWIEDPAFPVVPSSPPDFPLPRLLPEAASASFNTVPLLPVPEGPAFALSIPVTTLQTFLDAAAPLLKTAASQQGASLESITVYTNSPGSVTTSFIGTGTAGIPFSVSVTESLGTKSLPAALPHQSVPAVIGSSHSASVGGIPDWFIAFGTAVAPFALVAIDLGNQVADQVTGILTPLIAGIPSRIPFGNTDIPATPLSYDFPTLVLDWKSFEATDSGILGTGTTTIDARDQSMVALTIEGSHRIVGYQDDFAGGAGKTYNFTLVNLAPDTDKFSWQVFGTVSNEDSIAILPFDQAGSFSVFFRLPRHKDIHGRLIVLPGIYPFTLTVNATETRGSDSSKTLCGSDAIMVEVEVKQNPNVPRE
jgi:hypothetical protein